MKKGDALMGGDGTGEHTYRVYSVAGRPTVAFPKKDYTRKRSIWKLELMGCEVFNLPGYKSDGWWHPCHTKTLWRWRQGDKR